MKLKIALFVLVLVNSAQAGSFFCSANCGTVTSGGNSEIELNYRTLQAAGDTQVEAFAKLKSFCAQDLFNGVRTKSSGALRHFPIKANADTACLALP